MENGIFNVVRIVIILLVFTSCSAKWHLKQAIKKDPSIVKIDTISYIHTDTIFYSKDIIIPGGVDTVIKIDTVFETNRTLITKKNDSIRVIEKKFEFHHYDTIQTIDTLKIPYTRIEYICEESFINRVARMIGYVVSILVIALIIWRLLGK